MKILVLNAASVKTGTDPQYGLADDARMFDVPDNTVLDENVIRAVVGTTSGRRITRSPKGESAKEAAQVL